ncbi:unnamed protein product [Clavelina lepadiformis]|uniref:Uncharacterized protein n=1 Tax=Clavelina lepadiformis TaxID=159417 RepID=A0ABP0F6F4_CLALP
MQGCVLFLSKNKSFVLFFIVSPGRRSPASYENVCTEWFSEVSLCPKTPFILVSTVLTLTFKMVR